jgi:hypothetical protein
MAQPPTVVDPPAGEVHKHGSQKVTFSTAGELILEDIDYKKGMRSLRSTDEVGKPHKAAYVPDWGDGSATAQVKTATTRITLGETFSFFDTNGSTTINCIVTNVGVRYQQNEVTKIPISFAEKIN